MAINLIVASHGLFAQEALKSAEMILGVPQENAAVVSITAGRTSEECLEELTNIYNQQSKKGNGTLVLVDIFGGTPANIATYLTLTKEDVQVYSGLNIPRLLELFLSNPENMEQAKNIIESVHGVSLVDITAKAKEGMGEDGDSMDTY
jgi:PTS system mannose-specific IIA component